MNRSTLSATRPQQALQSYLDALLQEAFSDLESEAHPGDAGEGALAEDLDEFRRAVLEEQQRDARSRARPVQELPITQPRVLKTISAPLAVEVAPAALVAPPEVLPEPQPEPPIQREPGAVQAPPARPDWSNQPFECLLFDVAGLTLAVPLISLGSIYPLEGQELTPLFGQPDWFLGLLPCQAGNLRVLDTARWVLADRYREEFREGLQYVISVEGFEWGLAVHQVSRSIRLDPSEVKWRGERSQRPWLAGTVIEHMCALLDVRALAELIASGAQRA